MIRRKLYSVKRWLTRIIERKLSKIRHQKKLKDIQKMSDFEEYVEKNQPMLFTRYKEVSESKVIDFKSAIDHIGIDLNEKSFLDLGPAYGDSLDVVNQRGANRIDFTEFDPYFYTYNRLKPYTNNGYQIDHRKQLSQLPERIYDFIWCKGGISADYFIKFHRITSLSQWLEDVERLAKSNGVIMICPGWTNDKRKRNIEDLENNLFTKTMKKHGYQILPFIDNHNHEPDYPVTFYKKN